MSVLFAESDPWRVKIWTIHLTHLGVWVVQTESHQIVLYALFQLECDIIVFNFALQRGVVIVLADYASYHWPKVQIITFTVMGTVSDGSLFTYCLNVCACVLVAIGADD